MAFTGNPLGKVWMILLLIITISPAQRRAPVVVDTVDGDAIYELLAPDQIPAIMEPAFLSGVAAHPQMSDNEPVIGIIINGQARAYSLWQLDHHEIVNDVVGGQAIAVTW